jgi:hypothetical protein
MARSQSDKLVALSICSLVILIMVIFFSFLSAGLSKRNQFQQDLRTTSLRASGGGVAIQFFRSRHVWIASLRSQ